MPRSPARSRVPRPRPFEAIFDEAAFAADLDAIATRHRGDPAALKAAVVQRAKQELAAARRQAETWLREDGQGRACAARLSDLEDGLIRALYENIGAALYGSDAPSTSEHMAVVATGGYGRGLLAPGSDIDLLFLLPYKQTAWGESIAESILYTLWDIGQKVGHATRSIDECIRQAKADLTIRTAVLEARFICGDRALYDDLIARFDREVVSGTASDYVAAKLAERDERHRRVGASRYLVEPNVKDGKGGLRDLHTLFWIAKYVYRVREPAGLLQQGVFSKAEYATFRRAEDFLWSVRCHLHFLTGRAEERLSFDVQREMALRLGYTEHPGQRDVERFMKHYFLIAKDVGDLTRIVCSQLEENEAKSLPVLNRFVQRLIPKRRKSLGDNGDFVADHNRITITDEQVFERDPVNLIRLFWLADRHDLAFHPDPMRLITRQLRLVDDALRTDEEANRLFRDILVSRNDPETVLRRMDEVGLLGRFVPEFGRIVALMQFSMYHHYTVDEHLIRCIGVLSTIERGTDPSLGLANELFSGIQNRDLLYIALFLHDIAKGRAEDHSILGARVARRFCPRLGLTPAETDTVAWLVEHHLTMSTIAQSRDLSDRKTIETFAGVVQSLERLKMLTVLTTADINAVGPGVWNSWKAQLIRTLYYETEPVLTGGFSEVNRSERVAAAQDLFRAALPEWATAEIEAYIARHYPHYWLKVDLARKLSHALFVREAEAAGRLPATKFDLAGRPGVVEVTVLAVDHPRLLSVIAGACAAAGANIVDAQIYTTTDGLALDTIAISREFPEDTDETRRVGRVCDAIEKALTGDVPLTAAMVRRATPKTRQKAFDVPPEVTLNNQWSNRFTVIEVTGLDRPGLLHDLTTTLSRLNLNIGSAHIVTFGEKVVDVFYVTDLTGAPIISAQRQAAIKRALISVLAPPAGEEQAARPRAM
ncbi:MAG: [protein-PII] uridylyltransferase [Methylacidiphilales bacterium]|nr:[protein-PII] uridylyltransferase [Candidatus Methylacidiphilales bacterium]